MGVGGWMRSEVVQNWYDMWCVCVRACGTVNRSLKGQAGSGSRLCDLREVIVVNRYVMYILLANRYSSIQTCQV